MVEILKAVQWALANGATGVLALAVVGLSWAWYRERERVHETNQQRIADLKTMTDIVSRHTDKSYRLGGDMARVVEYLERQKRKSIHDR